MLTGAVVVSGLTKRFDETKAVDGIDFSVAAGSTTALLGGNGAGKTTTISMLLGLLEPSEGAITILGEDMRRNRFRVLPRINFSSPYLDMPQRLTVLENLTVFARLYGVKDARHRIAQLASELGIEAMLARQTGTLSAGQRTRAVLAKALINRPDILLLDEPTASLDPDTGDLVRSYLERYQTETGCTILIASHNMAEVERLADWVLMMRRGVIVDRGMPTELIARYGRESLEEVFLDIARRTGEAAEASL